MTSIELRGVTKRYGDQPAIEDVDLTVEDGELLVLVGPSGCGKTTLLRTIAGLETPDDGEVSLGGERVTDRLARERNVALMFQEYALFPNMTVAENVGFNLRMRGTDGIDERVVETVELLDIADLLDREVETLSGGQKQRVALGRAIADDPRAFLLDEPLANLDASLREQTRAELARLQADLGVTTVHVTHDQQEALTMGDRVAVMRDGSIVQVASPEEIYRRPATLFVARFVGSPTMNTFDGRYDPRADAVRVGPDGSATVDVRPAADADELVVGVRPEHVRVESAADPEESRVADAGADRAADGGDPRSVPVDHVQFEGAETNVFLDAGFGEVVARVRGDRTFRPGDRVTVGFDASAVHLFDAKTGERVPTDGE